MRFRMGAVRAAAPATRDGFIRQFFRDKLIQYLSRIFFIAFSYAKSNTT
jgi:hypothetical protein